jgi:hypothetical protein
MSDCTTCARDFLIPIAAIAGFKRNTDVTATVYPKKDWLGSHQCISMRRECHTTVPWNTLVSLLNGKVGDVGNVTVETE